MTSLCYVTGLGMVLFVCLKHSSFFLINRDCYTVPAEWCVVYIYLLCKRLFLYWGDFYKLILTKYYESNIGANLCYYEMCVFIWPDIEI